MSAREDLAEILARAADSAFVPEGLNFAGGSIYEEERELARADEVLRQMEWARRRCQIFVTTWKMNSEEVAERDNPLTLAPKDWKP